MMDQEVLQPYDVDLEDGELSDSSDAAEEPEDDDGEGYTPLQRPTTITSSIVVAPTKSAAVATMTASMPLSATLCDEPLSNCKQMQQALEEEDIVNDDSNGDSSSGDSSSSESTDSCLKKLNTSEGGIKQKKRSIRRTVMVRIPPTDVEGQKRRARFKKYDIWSASLQEEALTENMRDIDVTKSGRNDRNVENYDFTLKYRLNGENSLKRRLSNSTDDISEDSEYHQQAKRGRSSTANSQRKSAKQRLGGGGYVQRARARGRRGSSPTSGSDTSYEPRYLLDLDDTEGRDPLDVAREMANKLFEEKDELMIRIVDVLGTELPVEIYKETQRIEADGGMLIKNGKRRRTSGGIFLFLLKEDDRLTSEEQKLIFQEERQNSNKWRKGLKALSRDRKVEELKKRLSKQKELPALNTRKGLYLLGCDLNLESQTSNLSNPPPSPVGQEHSPEYKAHAINHVQADASPEKPSTSASALAALTSPLKSSPSSLIRRTQNYDEDILDVDILGDMDFF